MGEREGDRSLHFSEQNLLHIYLEGGIHLLSEIAGVLLVKLPAETGWKGGRSFPSFLGEISPPYLLGGRISWAEDIST